MAESHSGGPCRYELATEFEEAVGHAMDRGTNTKVLFRMSDVGSTEQEE